MSSTEIKYIKKDLPPKLGNIGIILTFIGIALVGVSYQVDQLRTSFNSIVGMMFMLSVGVGALFLVALEYIAGATWSTPFRRIAELIATVLFVVPLLGIPVYLNMGEIYHWMHPGTDEVLLHKQAYLNPSSFALRSVIFFVVMGLFYWKFTSNSRKQDITGDQKLTTQSIKFSAPFMFIFAISITMMAIDYMMSLEPHWFSTIYGVYYFAGSLWVALAVLTLFVIKLNENGYLVKGITNSHYYSLGGLMFAFTAFWTYMAFSQYMLIFYANQPEETFWFMLRMHDGWQFLSIALIFIHFIIPFGLLIQRPSKVNPSRLKFVAVWILFAHFYDLYWLVFPTYSHAGKHPGPVFGWQELAYPILCFGLIITVFFYMSKGKNLIPIGDPKLKRGLDFHL